MSKKQSTYFVLAFVVLISFFFYQSYSKKKRFVSSTGVIFNMSSAEYSKVGHPESKYRTLYILDYLKQKKILDKVHVYQERPATRGELYLVHDKDYVDSVLNEHGEEGYLTADKWSPYISKGMINAALTAAGSLVTLSEAIAKGEVKNGFAIIRPPGHHATRRKAMGFCIFNNIAIAAEDLLTKNLATRILIVDMDAHYGNGIVDIFKDNPQVYYVSFNQRWVFPYSNGLSTDHIKDIKINFQQPESEYLQIFQKNVSRAISDFKPNFIFVSSGFDAHWRDYMSNLSLSLTTYAKMSKFLVDESNKYVGGKIIFSLEGGYDLDVLPIASYNVLLALMGQDGFEDPIGPLRINSK